MADDAL